MKKQVLGTAVLILVLLCVSLLTRSYGADSHAAAAKAPAYEYATIRWGGRENTHVIRPGGQVEFVGNQLKQFNKPDRVDDRSFYMNIVLNGMAGEGWELVVMTADDMVLRRNLPR